MIFLIIATIIIIVLLWIACYTISNDYNKHRHFFSSIHKKKCIKDAGWAKVISQFDNHLSLGSIHTWLKWICFFFFILLIVLIGALVYCMMQMGKKRGGPRYSQI